MEEGYFEVIPEANGILISKRNFVLQWLSVILIILPIFMRAVGMLESFYSYYSTLGTCLWKIITWLKWLYHFIKYRMEMYHSNDDDREIETSDIRHTGYRRRWRSNRQQIHPASNQVETSDTRNYSRFFARNDIIVPRRTYRGRYQSNRRNRYDEEMDQSTGSVVIFFLVILFFVCLTCTKSDANVDGLQSVNAV